MFRGAHHNKPCQYCSRPMNRADYRLHATRDHYIPRSKGGKGQGGVVCCATCNVIKGDLMPEEWKAFMAAHPNWWFLTKLELRDLRRARLGLPSVQRARRARARTIKRFGRVVATVVPPELIYGASQPATERTEP